MALCIGMQKNQLDHATQGRYTIISARSVQLRSVEEVREARKELAAAIKELVMTFQQNTGTEVVKLELGDDVYVDVDLG